MGKAPFNRQPRAEPVNLVAVPAIAVEPVEMEDGGHAWRIWFLPDRNEPDNQRRELLGVSDKQRSAEWIAKALTFWISPGDGQDQAYARVRHMPEVRFDDAR